MVPPLTYDLDGLRKSLDPQEITLKTLPPSLVGTWLLPDGRARVEILPNGDPTETSVLRKFATAVLAVEPSASGPAISNYESGKTVTGAFVEAGILFAKFSANPAMTHTSSVTAPAKSRGIRVSSTSVWKVMP